MPELPEVETVRKVLVSWVKGKKIKTINSPYPKIISNVSYEVFKDNLEGKTIDDIDRYGKFLIFKIGNQILLSHLRMEGKYFFAHYPDSSFEEGITYDPINGDYKFNKHVHLVIEFSDGSLLLYHDVRKFGRFYLFMQDDYLDSPLSPLSKLGKEPFLLKDGEYLYEKARKDKRPLKEFLLDQTILVGLGNIYADEVCFLAKLSPHKQAKTLTVDEWDKVNKASIKVLNKAIEEGGSTIRSYHFANDASGRFQNELNVYGKEGSSCPVCGTPITKTRIGGRGTHFCASCQHEIPNKKAEVIGITGLIGSGKSSVSRNFIEAGFKLIDADVIAKDALNKDSYCYQEVVKHFGKDILDEEQNINRNILRKVVTDNPSEIIFLNNLIHPYVKEKAKEILKDGGKYLLDVPLLFESSMDELCDIVIFVNTKEDVRKKRLLARGTMSLKEASKLNGDSKEVAMKIAKSTIVIDNSLTHKDTRKQVLKILEEIEKQKEYRN